MKKRKSKLKKKLSAKKRAGKFKVRRQKALIKKRKAIRNFIIKKDRSEVPAETSEDMVEPKTSEAEPVVNDDTAKTSTPMPNNNPEIVQSYQEPAVEPSQPIVSKDFSKETETTAESSSNQTIAIELPGEEKINVPVFIVPHRPSPFVINLSQNLPPPPAQTVNYNLKSDSQKAIIFQYVNRVTLVSLAAFIYWLVVRLTGRLFRIPAEVLPLISFSKLPPLINDPLSELNKLSSLPTDKLYRPVKKQTIVSLVGSPAKTEFASSSIMPRLAVFAVTAMVIVVPIVGLKQLVWLQTVRAETLGTVMSGMNEFMMAGDYLSQYDYEGARRSFSTAESSFARAEDMVNTISPILRAIAVLTPLGSQYQSGQLLIDAAQSLASAGEKLSQLGLQFKTTDNTDQLKWQNFVDSSMAIADELDQARQALAGVEEADIPSEYRAQFNSLLVKTRPVLSIAIDNLRALGKVVPEILGVNEPRRFILIFQNNNELRPTGGFMGSFGILSVRNGEIVNFTMPGGGTYDLQGSLTKFIQAPEPLRYLNPRWEFQDINWWRDWPTSAKMIDQFYQWSGGETIDGVMAIDATVIKDLLVVTGPIAMPKYGLTIAADNFVKETTAEVEERYDRTENKPKQFLADMAPLLIKKIFEEVGKNPTTILDVLNRNFNEKHILMYLRNNEQQALIEQLGWGGEVRPLPRLTDSLGIVHTNIGGGKTDGVISDQVKHEVAISQDGRLVDTVVLARTHQGKPDGTLTGINNNDYIRFYVPSGSRLIKAEGFQKPLGAQLQPVSSWETPAALLDRTGSESIDDNSGTEIYQEFGRTVFANWLVVSPQETASVKIQYELPWSLSDLKLNDSDPWLNYISQTTSLMHYRFFWDKQPGTMSADFSHQAVSEVPVQVDSRSSKVNRSGSGWSYADSLRGDEVINVFFSL